MTVILTILASNEIKILFLKFRASDKGLEKKLDESYYAISQILYKDVVMKEVRTAISKLFAG